MLIRKHRKAFTLVELLIVIAVISILFVVLLSRVDFATDKSKTTGVQNDFHAIQTGLHITAMANYGFDSDTNVFMSKLNKNLDSEMFVALDNGMIKTAAKDPWGTQYVLEYDKPADTNGRVTIISAGPDTTLRTQDDIKSEVVFKVENGKADVIINNNPQNNNGNNNGGNNNNEHICVFNRNIKSEQFIAVSGTCTTKTLYYYSCSCGARSTTTFEGDFGEHQYDSGITTTPATCTSQGTTTFTCMICSDKQYSTIPIKAHTEVTDQAVAATCTTTGLTEGKHCSVCNTTMVLQQVIPAKGHTLSAGANCFDAQTCIVCNEVLEAALGHDYQSTVTQPTCTEAGYTIYTCTRCGDNYTDNTVPAKGHTEMIDAEVPATCTTTGLTEGKHCSVCNTIIKEQETIPLKGHSLGEGADCVNAQVCTVCGTEIVSAFGHDYRTNIVQPTCITDGYTTHTCIRCGNSYNDSIVAAKGHAEVIDMAIAATCTTSGLTEGKHCSVCNTVLVAQQTVAEKGHTLGVGADCTNAQTCTVCNTVLSAALGHNYKSTITQPTCTTAGYTTHTCTRCGDSYTDSNINAKGHTEVKDAAVEATCTTTGLTEGKHCSVCNAVLVAQQTIPLKGHTLGESANCLNAQKCTVCHSEIVAALGHDYKLTVKQATCTEAGYTTHTCSRCGDTYTDSYVAAKGHTEVTDKAIAATCTTTGLTAGKHCSVCNTIITAQTTVAALGHDKLTYSAKAATCTENGYQAYEKCSRCNYTTYQEIAATGHTEVNGGTSNVHKKCNVCGVTTSTAHSYTKSISIDATCTTKGTSKYTCGCGYSYTSQDIPMIDHVYGDDDFCDNCGSEKELAAGLYQTGSDYTILLKSWNQLISEGAIKVSGTTVSSATYTKLKGDLVIPNGITSIGTAFKSASYLTGVKIPNSVTTLSSNAFYGCSKLTHAYLPQSMTSIGTYAFQSCSSLLTITIPENVTTISNATFSGCKALTSVQLSSKTTSIGNSAFSSCEALTDFVIPDTVTTIGQSAFYYCKSLESIVLPSNLTIINESVFSNCSNLKEVTIPGSVTIIDDKAFRYCKSLESITIPEGVGEIGLRGFEGCSSLHSVYIPTTLKQIGTFSFIDCPNICSVYIVDMVSWVKLSFMTFNYDCHTNPLSYGADLYLNGELVTTLNLPEEVTVVYDGIFDGCGSITRVNIPATVTSMDEDFLGCMNIIEYNVDPKNKYYTSIDGILYGTRGGMNSLDLVHYPIAKTETVFVIPENVTEICDHAFAYSPYLEKIVFHENVYDIAYSALHGCDSGTWTEYNNAYYVGNDDNPYMTLYRLTSSDLTSYIIHPDTININSEAFEYCKSIESLTIPANIQNIGGLAFYNTSLKTLIFEDNSNLKKIVAEAFLLSSIQNVYITDLEAWCNVSMNYYTANPMYRGANLYVNNELLTSFNLQDITKIGDYTLYGCISLTDVVIPETVNYIGLHAFSNCSNLQSIEVKRLSGWVLYGNGGSPASNQYTNERDLSDVSINVTHFTSTYAQYSWRIEE